MIFQQIAFREKVGGDKAENGDDQDEDRQNADGLQVAHQHFFAEADFATGAEFSFGMLLSCPALKVARIRSPVASVADTLLANITGL